MSAKTPTALVLAIVAFIAAAVFAVVNLAHADPAPGACEGPNALVQVLKAERDQANDSLAVANATLSLATGRVQADEAELAKLRAAKPK